MIIRALGIINVAVGLVLWVPTWRKLWRTKRAADYSLSTMYCVLYLQAASLVVSIAEHAPLMATYTGVNTVVMTYTCWLIRKYQAPDIDGALQASTDELRAGGNDSAPHRK